MDWTVTVTRHPTRSETDGPTLDQCAALVDALVRHGAAVQGGSDAAQGDGSCSVTLGVDADAVPEAVLEAVVVTAQAAHLVAPGAGWTAWTVSGVEVERPPDPVKCFRGQGHHVDQRTTALLVRCSERFL